VTGSPTTPERACGHRMADRVALISGGARGQGAAHGRLFAEHGAHVLLGDVLDDVGEEHAQRLRAQGLDVRYRHLDVTVPDQWQDAVGSAEQEWGRLDVLVNNAGIVGSMRGVVEEDLESWAAVIEVNQTGVFLGMKYAIPALQRCGGGSIVNVCSIWGIRGARDYIAYQASKGAVQLMTKSAAITYAGDQIRANTVVPGHVKTAMSDAEGNNTNTTVAATPLGRGAQPEEVSYAVMYLASTESEFVTGTDLVIDGGYLAH
jgi:NAD(P)-dependent dehydrogenase (short-subunit alcohol dehydrogenase family)